MGIFVTILLIAVIIYILKGIIIVQQQEAVIIQRLGQYQKTLSPGLHWIVPFIESPRPMLKRTKQKSLTGRNNYVLKYSPKIDLRETVYDFPEQKFITKDNVTIRINALLYFQIIDAKKALYSVENLPEAIEKLTQTSIRNIVCQMTSCDTMVSCDIINDKLSEILDKATDKWGVKVNRVEVRDIILPT